MTSTRSRFVIAAARLPQLLFSFALLGLIGWCAGQVFFHATLPSAVLASGVVTGWFIFGFVHRTGSDAEGRLLRLALKWEPISDPQEALGPDAVQLLEQAGITFDHVRLYRMQNRDGETPVATGRHSIGLPQIVLDEIAAGESDPEVVAGVVAHEVAHLAGPYSHGPMYLWWASPWIKLRVWVSAMLLASLKELVGRRHLWLVGLFCLLLIPVLVLPIVQTHPLGSVIVLLAVLVSVWLLALEAALKRDEEFRADAFARDAGLGPGLVSYLMFWAEALAENDEPDKAGVWSTHPTLAARIERLQRQEP